jgi:hypothetical protein
VISFRMIDEFEALALSNGMERGEQNSIEV